MLVESADELGTGGPALAAAVNRVGVRGFVKGDAGVPRVRVDNGEALPRQGAVGNRGGHLLFYTVGGEDSCVFIFCGGCRDFKRKGRIECRGR